MVFFRDQDITPTQQLELGKYFGVIEVHPSVPQVPGCPGVTVIWPDLQIADGAKADFRKPGLGDVTIFPMSFNCFLIGVFQQH